MTDDDVKKTIWEVEDGLRNVMFSKNYHISLLRLVFLKYVTDNRIGMKNSADAGPSVLDMLDPWKGPYMLKTVMERIDSQYGFIDILSNDENLNEYSQGLFGGDLSKRRAGADDDARIHELLENLERLSLKDDTDHSLGKMIAEEIATGLYTTERNGYVRDYSSNESIVKLAGKILDIGPGDMFSDFMSGTGLSTFLLTKDTGVERIANADSDCAVIAPAVMLYILYGFDNIWAVHEDSLNNKTPELKGNKIFVDPPTLFKLKNYKGKIGDGTVAAVDMLYSYYLEGSDAIAVATVSNGFLSLIKNGGMYVRKNLVDQRMLKAVISLPSLRKNLLVISRRPSEKAVFIREDVSEETSQFRRERMNLLIDRVAGCVRNPYNEEGFSTIVPLWQIEKNDYNLNPSLYMVAKSSLGNRSLAEVEQELDEMYDRLLQKRPRFF